MAYQSPIIKLTKYFPFVEKVSLTAFVAGYVLKMLHYPGDEIVIISLSVLSGIYFLSAYTPPPVEDESEEKNQQQGFGALLGRTIVPKVLGIGSSVCVIGVLFTIEHYSGFREMLLIGSTSLAAASLLGLLTTMNNERARKALSPMLLRAVPLMLIAFYFLKVYGITPPVN